MAPIRVCVCVCAVVAFTIAPRLVVIGGRDDAGLVSSDVFALDVQAGVWTVSAVKRFVPIGFAVCVCSVVA